jgi:hypothetical protein
MSDVDLIINVHTNGVKDITNLSAATRALALNLRGITVPMTKLDAHSRAVNKALGMTNRSMNDHAKTVKQMVSNQKALGAETKRVQSNIKSYAMAIQSAGGTTTAFGRELIQSRNELKQFSSTLRGLRIRAFGSDLSSISLKLQRIGKDAQFVGRSLMINLTAPILLFARMGFQSLLKVDEQFVRLTKVLEGVAMTTEQANLKLKDYVGPDKEKRVKQLTDSFRDLNTALTEQSSKFGVAKDLVISLAVDFAELGVTANENIVALTELALAAEKLGGMDASGAQDLSSALFFNATRAYEVAKAFDETSTAAEREAKAIASATVQLNMFNTIENVTALSLKDLADSLPELGGMALSFGLSMTEAAALLAPMKAAGFDIGASANSIKVSLQRAIVPTKQNVELLARLSKQYGATGKAGNAFSESTKTGLTGLQAIVDIFGKVVEGGRNTEAGLKLMSEIFEKRQGPRMYVAIEQLNQFDAALKNVNNNQSPERLMAGVAEGSIRAFNKLNGTALPETITQFSDIGVIARIASAEVGALVDGFKGKGAGGSITETEKKGAIEARKAVALLIKEKKLNEDIDLISAVKTQAGRAMLVELAGASGAADVANMELEQSLNSLSVATQRMKIAFKNFAADILRNVAPTLKKLSNTINSFYLKWQALSDTTRERISKLILGFLGFLAVMAPVILALGTMQSSIGVLGRFATFFLPKLKNFEGGLVGIAGGAKKATKAMTDMYNSFVGKKQLNNILPDFAPSGGTPSSMIGIPQRVGKNVKFTGSITPDLPHDLADRTKLPTARDVYKASGYKTNAAGRLVDSSGKFVSSADAAKLKSEMSAAAGARRAASKANKAIMDPFNAAQKLSGEQYLRNEGSILSKRGMRVDSRGSVINSKGRFVGGNILEKVSQASVMREAALTDAGISRTGAGGARLATKRGLVDISESRALKIARGGVGGQIARRTTALPRLASSFTSATGVTGKGFLRGMLPDFNTPTTPFPSLRSSTPLGFARQAAQNVGQRIIPKNLVGAQGAANVGGIAKAAFNAGPVAAYTKSVQGAKAAVQAMKIEQLALGGGAGRIRVMTTAMTGFMKATKIGTLALKLMKIALISTGIGAIMLGIGVAVYIIVKNFGAFKNKASDAILRVKNAWGIFKEAIMLLIQPFVDLFSIIGGGSKKGGDAVGGLANAFELVGKVLQKVASWFKMLVENFIQPYLYMIIDIVMFVVSIFQGNWGKAFSYLIAAAAGAAKIVIKLIAALLKGMVWITAGGIKLVIGYFTLIPKAVAKAFSWLENLPFVGGIFGGISDGINTVVDSLYGLVDAGKNAANGVIDTVADAAVGWLDQGVAKGISSAEGEISTDTKIKDAAEETGEEAGEIMGNSFGDGFEESDATGKIAKAISEGVTDAVQQLQDYLAGELANALSKFVDGSVKALEKQKASALKVFDVQIKTLGKLEKAEESLTKKKEYEVNRRKLIDDKTLSDETYRRNYALAIYEGRVDDARALQQQQKADQRAFNDDLLSIDDARTRELAKENLESLKEAINEAKDAAGIFFEEAIAKFQESAALITKIAPVTVEQYTAQLQELQALTESNATSMNTTFGSMFETFATTIESKMPNKVVGPFAMNLDELVLTAKEKFGLGSDQSENTVIGITIGMLSDMGAKFGEGKQSVIDSFGTITSGLAQNFTDMKTKFLDEVKNDYVVNFKKALDEAEPTKVFNQAIIDGNLSILRSFQNMVDLNPGLMEKLKNSLDPAILKYIELKAAADAAKDAAAGAADAAAGGGADTGKTGTGSTPSFKGSGIAAGSRVDAWEKNNALRASKGQRALTYAEFTGNKIAGFKKGGIIPSRTQNQNSGYPEGYIPAPTQEGVPALLHGGEYILNAKAVQRIGLGALNKMNNNLIPKFLKGGLVPGGMKATPSNTRGTADRLEQQMVSKATSKPTGPIDITSIPGVTWKPLPQTIKQIPGVATVGKTYSSSQLKSLNLQPNTFLIPQAAFTSSNTKSAAQQYFTIGNRQEATAYAQARAISAARAAQTAEQQKWTTWERFIGRNTVDGVTTEGGPYKQSGLASAIEKFPLAAILTKDLVVESIKSMGRTLSLSNARKYLNFGAEGPSWKERLAYGAEDVLNIVSLLQLTKPLTEPLRMPVTAILKKRAIAEAATVYESATGVNLIARLEQMSGGNTFKGLQTQGRFLAAAEKFAWKSNLDTLPESLLGQARTVAMKNSAFDTVIADAVATTAASSGSSLVPSNILGGGSGRLALNPAKQIKLSMGARGADLSKMIQSGVIDSTLATESGYISNQKFLSELGIVNEEYSSYNLTRSRMQAPDGVLKGNVNYGYARLADDFSTAANYREFHMNISEAGALYMNETGAWLRNIQGELDKMLGGAIIDLRPNAAMTYTQGDSYNMFLRNLLTSNNPAQNLPQYLGDIPLVAEYGDKLIADAAGNYTEVQFPSIPFDNSAIESITLTRKDLMRYYEPPGTTVAGGWGSDYLMIAGPQEQLVMQRELAKQLADLGIDVKTGVDDVIFNENFTKSTLTAKMDPVPLHQIPQDEFDKMLLSITQKLRADQGLPSIPQDVITSDTFNIKSIQDGIKGFIANYRTASSLLSMPTESVSSALNASVFDSAGGRLASNLGRIRGGIGEILGRRTTGRLESLDVIPDAVLRSSYGTYGDIGGYLDYVMGSNRFQPRVQKLFIEELMGTNDFVQSVGQGFRTPSDILSYGVFGNTRSLGNLGANLDGVGLSNTQLATREYILKNVDLTQQPDLLDHILQMINADLGTAMYIPYADNIQEFAYKMDNYGLGNVNPKTYNKMSSSLYLQARQAEGGVSLGQLGWNTPENFKIFDDLYEQYLESYMQTVRAIKNAGTSMTGDELPLEGINFEEFSKIFKGSLLGVAEMDPNDLIVQLLRGGDVAGAKDQLTRRIYNMMDQRHSYPGNSITPYAIDNGLSEVGRYQIRRTINPALEPGWFFKLKQNASLLTEAGDEISVGNALSSAVSSLPSGQGLSIYSRDAASVLGRRNAGIFTAPFTTSGTINSSASSALIQTDLADTIRQIQDTRTQYYPAGMTVDGTPLSEMLEQMVRKTARPFSSGAGWELQPQNWTWQDEINLLKMSENSFGGGDSLSSRFGRGIPIPDGFSDYVKQIWQANAGYISNAPSIDDQAITRIWEDFVSTKNQLFTPVSGGDPMEFKSFMRDPLSGYYYPGIAQKGTPFDLTDLDSVISSGYSGNLGIEFSRNNWIDPTSNVPIISPVDAAGEKFHGALYQLAGRIIPEIQTQAIGLFSPDEIKASLLGNLTPQTLLESQDFARYLNLPVNNFTTETDQVLADVLATMRELKGYKTGSLFAAETPLQPTEFDWWLNLLKEAQNHNLNYRLPLPEASGPNLTMNYGGLPYGQIGADGPFTFKPTKSMSSKSEKTYGSPLTNVADWLTGMTDGAYTNRITRSRIQQSFFNKLIKWYEAADGTNPISPTEHYYDYFASLTRDMADKSQFGQLIDITKRANSMSPISGLVDTGRYLASLPYMQNINAARSIQSARFLNSGTAVQYSDDVSHFAQELAAKFASYAPLFARGGNTFTPLGDISIGVPKTLGNVADLMSRGNLQSPSAILEELVMAQIKGKRLSAGMTDTVSDKSLVNVGSFIKKYGKMKIKGFKTGGYVPGSPSTAIPAILHGGEYVINADAVRNMGVRTMQSINQSKFKAPSGAPSYAGGGQTTNVSTVNINVDTFIGEEEWFKGMMKDYNMNVLPKQQKTAGLESRTFTSYNGIQGF